MDFLHGFDASYLSLFQYARHMRAIWDKMGLKKTIFSPVIVILNTENRLHAIDICKKLPIGTVVIIRDYDHPQRMIYAQKIMRCCRRYRLRCLVAGDIALARQIGASGVHLPEYMAVHWHRYMHKYRRWCWTLASHWPWRVRLRNKRINRCVLPILSPIWPTQSHLSKRTVPRLVWYRYVRQQSQIDLDDATYSLPCALMGGVNARNVKTIRTSPPIAVAALRGWKICHKTATFHETIGCSK
jgi:thiamine monophosphate synthase